MMISSSYEDIPFVEAHQEVIVISIIFRLFPLVKPQHLVHPTSGSFPLFVSLCLTKILSQFPLLSSPGYNIFEYIDDLAGDDVGVEFKRDDGEEDSLFVSYCDQRVREGVIPVMASE